MKLPRLVTSITEFGLLVAILLAAFVTVWCTVHFFVPAGLPDLILWVLAFLVAGKGFSKAVEAAERVKKKQFDDIFNSEEQ